jgi:hypothetical protein
MRKRNVSQLTINGSARERRELRHDTKRTGYNGTVLATEGEVVRVEPPLGGAHAGSPLVVVL